MTLTIKATNASCGAVVTGINLKQPCSDDLIAELRAHWLTHKVLVFPEQTLNDNDLVRFSQYFGKFGQDPFFKPIEGQSHIAAIQRKADEKTAIFAEHFHSDWSFMEIPPAATMLFGITIPPQGGNTLFADQVAAYERLPNDMREIAEQLTAIHSAQLAYAPDGAYGDNDQQSGRSMDIITSDKALETVEHPFVRTHPETGKKALFSSMAYIIAFKGLDQKESDELRMKFYQFQTQPEFIYSHPWQKNMLVMWDNRSVLHSATGGYDGYDRLLHRTTIADTVF